MKFQIDSYVNAAQPERSFSFHIAQLRYGQTKRKDNDKKYSK